MVLEFFRFVSLSLAVSRGEIAARTGGDGSLLFAKLFFCYVVCCWMLAGWLVDGGGGGDGADVRHGS